MSRLILDFLTPGQNGNLPKNVGSLHFLTKTDKTTTSVMRFETLNLSRSQNFQPALMLAPCESFSETINLQGNDKRRFECHLSENTVISSIVILKVSFRYVHHYCPALF